MSELKKIVWVNNETPLNEDNLNAMTDKIWDNSKRIDDLESASEELSTNIENKANKVENPTSDNLVSLDANGNLVNSGINKKVINDLSTGLNSKQETLVSGKNIKTINNESILGEGNIVIAGGGSITVDEHFGPTSPNAQSGFAVAEAVEDKMNVEIVSELPAKTEGVENTLYNVLKTEELVVDGKDYVEYYEVVNGTEGSTTYVLWGITYKDEGDEIVANATIAGEVGACVIAIKDSYIAYCIEHSTKIETSVDTDPYTKFDIYTTITTNNKYLFADGRYVNLCVGDKTDEGGEIFNTYEDKTYTNLPYSSVVSTTKTNKAISKGTTATGASNISGCKAFKILSHSGIKGTDGSYTIAKTDESDALYQKYLEGELYPCYSTWLFTSTGGNNRAEMIESDVVIEEGTAGDYYTVSVSNFMLLESGNDFADNVSYIRFYEKYTQNSRIISKPLVELGDTSIEGWSFSSGLNNQALGLASFTSGNENIADGAYSFVAGRQNQVGFTSFATGRWNKAKQYGAVFGQSNNVSGKNGLAAGSSNTAKGTNSTALGANNTVSGDNGFASGSQNIVKGINGAAFGNKNTVIGNNSSVFGCFNEPSKILFDKSEDDEFNADNIVIHNAALNKTITYSDDDKGIIFKGSNTANTIGLKNSGKLIKLSSNNDYRIVCHYVISNDAYYEPSTTYFNVFIGTEDINKSGKTPITNLTNKIDTNLQTVTIDFNSGEVNTSKCCLYIRIDNSTLKTKPVQLDGIEVHKHILSSIGNGSSDSNRSNAFEVYKDGHAEVQTVGDTDNSVVTKKYVDDKAFNTLDMQQLVDMMYPVGSIYISLSETNPFKNYGTWEKIDSETFLMSAGTEENSLGQTGGSNTINIRKDNLPTGINSITANSGSFVGTNAIETTNNPTSETYYIVENAGISEAINSTPKYLAVNMWKRVP